MQKQIKITGAIVGVGLRYLVYKRALEFALLGNVRNAADGSVMIIVKGPEDAIKTLILLIKRIRLTICAANFTISIA